MSCAELRKRQYGVPLIVPTSACMQTGGDDGGGDVYEHCVF